MRRVRAIATIIPLLGLWLAAALAPACCVQQACCAHGMCPLPRRPAEPASSEHGAHHPAQTAEQKGDCALQSTNTTTKETEFVIQPELILFLSSHWEVKAGVPLGVTSTAPRAGFKFQVAWIFGGSD